MKYLTLFCTNAEYEKKNVNRLCNKNQPDAHSFLIYSNKYPLHVSNRFIIRRHFTVHAVSGI